MPEERRTSIGEFVEASDAHQSSESASEGEDNLQ